MSQLPLGFSAPPALGEADFVETDSNREALAWLHKWPDWPSHGLVLYGPKGSGKTHLAHIWAERAGAGDIVLIDDVLSFLGGPSGEGRNPSPTIAPSTAVTRWTPAFAGVTEKEREEELFHLLNSVAGRKGHILLTAAQAPVLWPVQLPDLRSRLLALPTAHISLPDDAALQAVMSKLFADRQLRVPAEVIDYLVRRMERSFVAVQAAVAALDAAALASGRAVTLPFARDVLKES